MSNKAYGYLEIMPFGHRESRFIFDAERVHEVEDAAASLARALGGGFAMAIQTGTDRRFLNDNGVFRVKPPQADLPNSEQT